MKKPMNSFQAMTSLLKTTEPTLDEKKSINSFFMCRWLGNNINTLPIANMLNIYYGIPIEVQYRFAKDIIKTREISKKVKFINFSKDKMDQKLQKLLDNISRKYNVSAQEAQEYFKLMNNDERNRLYHLYDEGKK